MKCIEIRHILSSLLISNFLHVTSEEFNTQKMTLF